MKTKLLIQDHFLELTKSEAKIAEYILNDENDTIVFRTLSETSKLLNVGEATIVRFCKRLGFDGFQDMKLMLALEKESEETEESKNKDSQHLLVKDKMIKILDDSAERIDMEVIEEAAGLVRDAKTVYIIGVGASGYVAEIFEDRLMRIGVKCRSMKDGHLQMTQAAVAEEGDLFVAISLTGLTEDIYLSAEEAQSNGAKVIAVTNHSESPLAELANCVLLTAGFESPLTGGDFMSIISQFYVLSLVCDLYMGKYPVESYQNKTNIARAIRKKVIKP